MIIALTGTPGTGKTSIAEVLIKNGFIVIDLNKIACDKNFLIGKDSKRDSNIVDIEKLNKYVLGNYSSKEIIILEGHLSHLLNTVDKIIILRCHPKLLKKNLLKKGWTKEKISENLEAEILDVILCESVELHKEENIFEINVSNKKIQETADLIIDLIKNKFKKMKKYKIGQIDWSEEILKDIN
jgi:adenylate kinase